VKARLAQHRVLARLRPDALLQVVGPTLPWAEPGERAELASLLIDTHDTAAIAHVIDHTEGLDESVATRLEGVPDRPFVEALQRALDGNSPGRAGKVARVICTKPRLAATPIVADLLIGEKITGEPARELADALVSIAVQLQGNEPESAERVIVERSIVRLLEAHHEHRVTEVAIAGLLLATNAGPSLTSAMDEDDGIVLAGLRRGFRFLEHPQVAANIFRWIATRQLGRAAARRLVDIPATHWPAAFKSSHMLLCHTSRLALRNVDRPVRSLPPRDIWQQLPESAQNALPGLIHCLNLARTAQESALHDLLTLPASLARVRAINALATMPSQRPILTDHLSDREPMVARAAFDGLRRTQALGGSVWNRALTSSDPWLTQQARFEIAQQSATQYFTHWLDLTEAQRIAVARQHLDTNRDELLPQLVANLRSDDRATRLAAIRLIRRLSCVQRVQPVIIELTDAADPFVASSAVAALVDGGGDDREHALVHALEHHHPRVRANAVDVMAATPDPFIVDRDNRLRANAVVAASRANDTSSGGALASMLRDDDPMHRISALWASQTLGRRAPLREIRAIASADAVEQVRNRATRTVRLLEAATDFGA